MLSKLKCKECKEYRPAEAVKKTPTGRFCVDRDCAYKFFLKKREEQRLRSISKAYLNTGKAKRRPKAQVESDLKAMKRAAVEACHRYIRERDRGKPCICCGKELGDQYDAGHYKKSTHSYTKFDEDNIFGQRRDCNRYKGGNESGMRAGMLIRIGAERLLRIEQLYKEPIKRNAEDYKKIRDHYIEKLNALNNSV